MVKSFCSFFKLFMAWAGLFLICACQNAVVTNDDSEIATRREKRGLKDGKLFNQDAFSFDAHKPQESQSIGINKFLWRASLEIVRFLPLAQADPFGGVILTDWYQKPGENQRIKVNIHILESRLKADGVKVSVFRQAFIKNEWKDQAVDMNTAQQLEDAILTKARHLRMEAGQ
jgi:hypothetical protein